MNQYKRKDLTEGDVCCYCGKDLRVVNEIHTAEGHLSCSKECLINFYIDEVTMNAKASATALYNDLAEVVTPEDIGLCQESIYTAYSNDSDITFIMKDTLDGDKVLKTEVVGFYHGGPDESATETYTGSLVTNYE